MTNNTSPVNIPYITLMRMSLNDKSNKNDGLFY